MSTTATHGLNQYVEIENPGPGAAGGVVQGAYFNVTSKVTNVNMAFDRENADTSTLGEGDKTNLPGQRAGSFSMDSYNDPALRDLVWNILMSSTPVRVRYGPQGNGQGKERMTAYFNITSFGEGGSISSAVGGSLSFTRTGPTTRDAWPTP
jgi:hypothetical protein